MEIYGKAEPTKLKAADDMLTEGNSPKQKEKNSETDQNCRKGDRVEDQEKHAEPNGVKSEKCHSLRIRSKNRSVFRLYELTTPLEKRIYFQLQKAREENTANKKKIIRYFNLLKKFACRKKVKL